MHAIDKAMELVTKYNLESTINVVDEILWALTDIDCESDMSGYIEFWQEVKNELDLYFKLGNVKSCQSCFYSKNGKTSCGRFRSELKPNIDKGSECVGNFYAHYRNFELTTKELELKH